MELKSIIDLTKIRIVVTLTKMKKINFATRVAGRQNLIELRNFYIESIGRLNNDLLIFCLKT